MRSRQYIPPQRYLVSKLYPIEEQWPDSHDPTSAAVALTGASLRLLTGFGYATAEAGVALQDAILDRVLYFGTLDIPGGRYTDPYTDTPLQSLLEQADAKVAMQDATLDRVLYFGTLDLPAGRYEDPYVVQDLSPYIDPIGASLSLAGASLDQVVRYSTYEHPIPEMAGGSVTLVGAQLN